MTRKPRFLLMGTPMLAKEVFEVMLQAGYEVVGIVCQPDKITGRDQTLEKPPTKRLAEQYGIPVFQPKKIKEDPGEILSLDIDYILTLAYGQIVPQAVLDLPKYGAYNLHGSLLPLLRGASPLHYALIEGFQETGVTLMKMVLAMDAGDMLAHEIIPIHDNDTYTSLLQRFSKVTQAFILKQLPLLISDQLKPIPQDASKVTFAPLIKKDQEHLDLTLPPQRFLGWVKALSEEPGGYVFLDGKKLKLFDVTVEAQTMLHPLGTILELQPTGLRLQGNGAVYCIKTVQLEGKTRQPVAVIAHGYAHWVGQCVQ